MRPRMVLPIRLYGSSSITLNERFRRLENSNSRRGMLAPLGIRRSNSQRTPVALRLGQKSSRSFRGRRRSMRSLRRTTNSSGQRASQPLQSSADRGTDFRGRGRLLPLRGRGAARVLSKRRSGTRRFKRGGAINNADPDKLRADLDQQLNEYMGGGN